MYFLNCYRSIKDTLNTPQDIREYIHSIYYCHIHFWNTCMILLILYGYKINDSSCSKKIYYIPNYLIKLHKCINIIVRIHQWQIKIEDKEITGKTRLFKASYEILYLKLIDLHLKMQTCKWTTFFRYTVDHI